MTTTSPEMRAPGQRRRVLVLGASGFVGECLVRRLDGQENLQLILAARDENRLHKLAGSLRTGAAVRRVDLDDGASIAGALDGADLVVNCSGQFHRHGLAVVGAAIERGLDLVDIADEPVFVKEVLTLDDRARAAGSTVVIGSGTAPQTSGAMIRSALARVGSPADVTLGIVFGINRVGVNAVRTATEAVGGLIAVHDADRIWERECAMEFPPPFGRYVVRRYPLPETVYLPGMHGVRSGFAGVTLSSGFFAELVRGLQRIGFAAWIARSSLARPFCTAIAAVETAMARTGLGKTGIALRVEAKRDGATAVIDLYHGDMTELTATALALTVSQVASGRIRRDGVQLGHEVVEPEEFLAQLRDLGARWSAQAETAA